MIYGILPPNTTSNRSSPSQSCGNEFFIHKKLPSATATATTTINPFEEQVVKQIEQVYHQTQQSFTSSTSSSSSESFDWSSSYYLKPEQIPDSHLSMTLANQILFTGKAILLLQQYQSSSSNANATAKGRGLNMKHSTGSGGNIIAYLSQGLSAYFEDLQDISFGANKKKHHSKYHKNPKKQQQQQRKQLQGRLLQGKVRRGGGSKTGLESIAEEEDEEEEEEDDTLIRC